MRKVIRPEQPKSLKDNAKFWTDALLAEIARTGNYSKVNDSFKNKYNQQDIKESLSKMYNNHCCYCECLIGIQTYGRIEHLKPKSLPQFYDQIYEWNNMHWACEICNTSYKRVNWDDCNPILDPSKDNIALFLALDLTTGEYYAVNNNKRALTTIKHTGINREKLVVARRRLIIQLCKNYKRWMQCDEGRKFIEEVVKDREDYDFPSVFLIVAKALSNV